MKRWAVLAACMLAVACGGASAPASRAAAKPVVVPSPTVGGAWRPAPGLRQEPLWPGAPPDSPAAPGPAETTRTATNPAKFAGLPVTGVYDVSVPTMTVYPARRPGTRAAVLVFPGGGFQQLAIDLEGTEVCYWLTARGVTCVLVKYRVPGSNHFYDAACRCHRTPAHLTALADAQRAIRLVRARAASLGVAPDKIGVIGFSAGGYLVAQTSNILTPAYRPVDAIDRISSRPDFALALYPGHLCRAGGVLDPGIRVTRRTPPTFVVQAWDDPVDEICNSTLYARALDRAGVPTEVHLFASGGHAFGLRRANGVVDAWPALAVTWLARLGIL